MTRWLQAARQARASAADKTDTTDKTAQATDEARFIGTFIYRQNPDETRFCQEADAEDRDRDAGGSRQNPVVSGFCRERDRAATNCHETGNRVLSVVSVLSEGVDADPAEAGAETFPHGTSVGGSPRTWTGRVVSLDAWRAMSEWERHGPNGRHWNGITRQWEHGEDG